jgi:hypothetical protein
MPETTPPTPVRPGPLQAVMAIVLPVVVLGLALGWLGRPVERELSGRAQELEQALSGAGESGPDVVLIGNSMVRFGIDTSAVAKALKLPSDEVVYQTVAGSRAGTWYAVLKNRVYANGYRPRLVIVGTSLNFLLDQTLAGNAREQLEEQLTDDEPVIDAKVFGASWSWLPLKRARGRRGAIKTGVLVSTRDIAVGALMGGQEPGQDGHSIAEDALQRVFADGAVGVEQARVIPIVERQDGTARKRRGLSVDESMVPDLVRLTQEYGSRLVFVRIPSPGTDDQDRRVTREEHEALVRYVDESPAVWLDFGDLQLKPSDFNDNIHLGRRGRAQFSTVLTAALAELDVFREGKVPSSAMPVAPPSVTRATAPVAVESLTPRRAKDTACGWVLPLPKALRPLSDNALRRDGIATVSPIQLIEDGTPLTRPTVGKAPGLESCDGTAAHRFGALHFSPSQGDPADHTYSVVVPALEGSAEQLGSGVRWLPPATEMLMQLEPPSGVSDTGSP